MEYFPKPYWTAAVYRTPLTGVRLQQEWKYIVNNLFGNKDSFTNYSNDLTTCFKSDRLKTSPFAIVRMKDINNASWSIRCFQLRVHNQFTADRHPKHGYKQYATYGFVAVKDERDNVQSTFTRMWALDRRMFHNRIWIKSGHLSIAAF